VRRLAARAVAAGAEIIGGSRVESLYELGAVTALFQSLVQRMDTERPEATLNTAPPRAMEPSTRPRYRGYAHAVELVANARTSEGRRSC